MHLTDQARFQSSSFVQSHSPQRLLALRSLCFGSAAQAEANTNGAHGESGTAGAVTPDWTTLLQRLQSNDPDAWLEIQAMYQPQAKAYANMVATRSGFAKGELIEAAEFGLLVGIGQMRQQTFDVWNTPVHGFLRRHISQAVSELVNKNKAGYSLNENWGEEGGFFNPFEATSKEQDPVEAAMAAEVEVESTRPETAEDAQPLPAYLPEDTYPALGLVESWALRTMKELDSGKGLSDALVAKRLGLSEDAVHQLRLKVRRKVRARVAYLKAPKSKRKYPHQPYPHLKAIDRMAVERRLLIPVLSPYFKQFTPHEQKLLQLMGHFEMTPKQVAKALKSSESAVAHEGIVIAKKIDRILATLLQPENGFAAEAPQQEGTGQAVASLLQTLRHDVGIASLTETHWMQLTHEERVLLQAVHGEGPIQAVSSGVPVEVAEARRQAVYDKLRQLTGQSARQFQQTLLNPLAGVQTHLEGMDATTAQIVSGVIGDGQSVKAVARSLPKVTIAAAQAKLDGARVALRKAMMQDLKTKPSVSSEPAIESAPIEIQPVATAETALCEALVREGLVGLTPALMTRTLTPYQLQMLRLRAQGLSYSEMAQATGFLASPVKAAVAQGLTRLKKELSLSYLVPLIQKAGVSAFQVADDVALSPQTRRLLRQYFIEGHNLQVWGVDHPASSAEAGALGRQLEASALKALSELPPKQQEILLDYIGQDVSYSELARQRGVTLTIVTSMIKAALGNVAQALNPFGVHHWLNQQGLNQQGLNQQELEGVTPEALSQLDKPAQYLLQILAQKGLGLEAWVDRMNGQVLAHGQPLSSGEKLSDLNQCLLKAWDELPDEGRRVIQHYAEANYQMSALSELYDGMDCRLVFRDKLTPAIRKVHGQVGRAPLATKLRLRGFGFISGNGPFGKLPTDTQQFLAYYLDNAKSLLPMAQRIRGVSMGEADAVQWLQDEMVRAMGTWTPHQQAVWRRFAQAGFNAAETGRQLGTSQKSVAAAMRLILNKTEQVWQSDGLLMRLKRQGVVALREASQLNIWTRADKVLLGEYLARGYSVAPILALQRRQTGSQTLSLEDQVRWIQTAFNEAVESLSSDLQRGALRVFAEGQCANYQEMALAIGLKAEDRNRVGALVDAALSNVRKKLENVT